MSYYDGDPWWDADQGRLRSDVWPFQKRMNGDNKAIAKQRIGASVQSFLRSLPDGWSVSWRVKRGHTFRVERSTKTIRVPFPRTHAGTATMAAAMHLAHSIVEAEKAAAHWGGIPGHTIEALGFPAWRIRLDYAAMTADASGCVLNTSHIYWVSMPKFGYSGRTPLTHKAWKTICLASARETVRYLSSPNAWKGGTGKNLYRNKGIGMEMVRTIAYRKALMDYLKVNDPRFPLPKRAKRLLAKHVPVTQP